MVVSRLATTGLDRIHARSNMPMEQSHYQDKWTLIDLTCISNKCSETPSQLWLTLILQLAQSMDLVSTSYLVHMIQVLDVLG